MCYEGVGLLINLRAYHSMRSVVLIGRDLTSVNIDEQILIFVISAQFEL